MILNPQLLDLNLTNFSGDLYPYFCVDIKECYDFAEHMLFMGSSKFPDENEVCTVCNLLPLCFDRQHNISCN
jgi:hypothetical protein